MRHRLFVHLVWATRDRRPSLGAAHAEYLETYFRRVTSLEHARLVEFGAVRSHVHLLVRHHPARVLSRLIQRLKGGSAYCAWREHSLRIEWHPGYSADAVSVGGVMRVAQYIAAQHLRHPHERIPGWPRAPEGAEAMARARALRFLASLDRSAYGGERRRPHGGS